MKALHAKGVVHRDLKPQNILLSHNCGKACPQPHQITLKIGKHSPMRNSYARTFLNLASVIDIQRVSVKVFRALLSVFQRILVSLGFYKTA